MVWQREGLGMKCTDVAVNLGIDPTTVWRTVSLFRSTGSVQKKSYPRDKSFTVLSPALKSTIVYLVLMHPGIYLLEIQTELADQTGADLSLTAIWRFLHRIGFTRQRLRVAALQRDEFLRSHNVRGKPLVTHKFLFRGERISAIAFMSVNGMLDCKTVKQTVNSDVFYDFVQSALLPHLMPFDGKNPHSIVVLDNCSIHHIPGIVEMIQEVGALVHFLPPYSPDYNPIEKAFSKVKSNLKAMGMEADVFEDPENLVLAAFSSITPSDCQKWVDHAGIYIK